MGTVRFPNNASIRGKLNNSRARGYTTPHMEIHQTLSFPTQTQNTKERKRSGHETILVLHPSNNFSWDGYSVLWLRCAIHCALQPPICWLALSPENPRSAPVGIIIVIEWYYITVAYHLSLVSLQCLLVWCFTVLHYCIHSKKKLTSNACPHSQCFREMEVI